MPRTPPVLGAETLAVEGRSGDRLVLRVATPAGVEVDARGYIKVDELLRTSAPGVSAMGECAGSPQFTHVAFNDFRIVRAQLDPAAWPARSTLDRMAEGLNVLFAGVPERAGAVA